MILRLSVGPAEATRMVVLETREGADCADLPGALGLPSGELVRVGSDGAAHAIPARGPLAASGLLDGDRVLIGTAPVHAAAGKATDSPRVANSGWQLRVVAGPANGRIENLPLGTVSVGRSTDNLVRIEDREASRMHLSLEVDHRAVHVTDLQSANGTHVDGKPVGRRTRIRPGARIQLGQSIVELVRVGADDDRPHTGSSEPASTEPDGNGGLLLNRVLSLRTPCDTSTVTFPQPERQREKRSIPWIQALLPVVVSVAIAVPTGNYLFLAFAALGPVSLAASVLSNRYADKKAARTEKARYEGEWAEAQAQIAAAVSAEAAWRRTSGPSGAEVAAIILEGTGRLWERSPQDVDFLQVRVGTGAEPAALTLQNAPSGTAVPHLPDVPLCVDLRSAGVLGIAGAREDRLPLARSVLVQLAGLHAADEVRISLITEHAAENDWGALRWLPHAWTGDERRLDVAQGSGEIDVLVDRLQRLVDERAERRANPAPATQTVHVMVMDGVAALRRRDAVARLLATGPACGVHAIVLDEELRFLPEECRVKVAVTGQQLALEDLVDRNRHRTGQPDGVDPVVAAEAMRALAPIRRVGGHDGGRSGLPTQITLFEMLGERPSIGSVTDRWKRAGRPRTSVPVGVGVAGLVEMDLVRSGPHALVAGSTDTGKSELVQTWIASMALHNRPDELAFLFIEYKGLSAFQTLRDLPHCVGTITNLSPTLLQRALASLNAEKLRRQALFEKAGAVDFAGYQEARLGDPGLEPMPRLVIAIDEFAELKEALPQFVTDLISIFRTGRSIGVHLVLATQQLHHVSSDITGNASLRACLRTVGPEDSNAVIGSKEASALPMTIKGRAYVRRGNETPDLLQGAWSRAPVDTTERGAVTAHPWPWRSDEQRMQTTFGAPPVVPTELADLVQVMVDTAEQMGIDLPRRPFTEALAQEIPLPGLLERQQVTQLADLVRLGGPVVGETDDLARQVHEPYALPLLRGHVAVIGSVKSGRTTAARTTVSSWAQVMPPSMLNVHVIDSGRGLSALTALPHTGTVTNPEGPLTGRLLTMLAGEVARRLASFEQLSMGDLVELWDHPELGDPMPWTLLVVDRFEDFFATIENSALETTFERILTHGAAAGVTVLALGDETLSRMRWQQRFGLRLVLRNTAGLDPTYVGLPARTALGDLVDGRCYESGSGRLLHFAHDGASPATGDQNQAIRDHGSRLAEEWSDLLGEPPVRLRLLPDDVSPATLPPPETPYGVVLGLGGDAAAPLEVGIDSLPLLVIANDAADRAEVLGRVAQQWAAAGLDVLVTGPPGALLCASAGAGVQVVTAEAQLDWAAVLADPQRAVLADELHADALPDDLVTALERGVPRCRFVGGSKALTFVPAPLQAVARAGTLLYLTPQDARSVDNFGVRVDPTLCAPEPRGRAVLVRGRQQAAVQVALED